MAKNAWERAGRQGAAALVLAILAGLTGCASFFPPLTSTSTTTTSTGTGNYVFALAPTLGQLSVYTIGTSTLTVGTNSPLTLTAGLTSATAGAVTVSRNNDYVYVGGVGSIYCYSIGTSGALTEVTTSSVPTPLSNTTVVSMDTSPDGNYLFALDSTTQNIYEYTVNAGTGALGYVSTSVFSYKIAGGTTNVPKKIVAGTNFVVAALGTGGDVYYPYSSTSGLNGTPTTLYTGSTQASDNDIAVSPNGDYVYIVRSGYDSSTNPVNEVLAYPAGAAWSSGVVLSEAAGTTPARLLTDGTGGYLYVANQGSQTLSQYSITTGTTLAPLSTASFASGMVVTSLARDSTGTYVFDGGIASSNSLQMFTLSSGALKSAPTASPGYDTAGLQLATTH